MSLRRLSPRWYHLAAVALILATVLVSYMEPSGDTDGYENVGYWIGQGRGIVSSKINVPFQDACPEVAPGLSVFVYQPFGLPLFYALVGYEHARVAHRILHVALYVLLSYLAFRLARRALGDDRLGGLAVLLILVAPVAVTMTATATADLFLLVLFMATLYFLVSARDAEADGRARWLLLAAVACAILSVSFRVPAIILLVSFGWFVCCDLIAGRLRKAALDLLAILPFVAFCALFLYRNYVYSGSVTGLCPTGYASACVTGFGAGALYAGKHLLVTFVPETWFNSPLTVYRRIAAAPLSWRPWANAVFEVLLALGLVAAVRRMLRPRALVLWPRRTVASPLSLFLVTGAAYVLLLTVILSRLGERGFEPRYYIPLVGIGWLALLAAGRAIGRPGLLLWIVGLVLFGSLLDDLGFVAARRQAARSRVPQPSWVVWLDRNTPAEATFLTDRTGVSAGRPRRHVYWITTWHCGYALPARLRSESGLAEYANHKRIEYFVLGRLNGDEARTAARSNYGDFILDLMERRAWVDRVVYADGDVTVYALPPAQARAAGVSATAAPSSAL